MTQEIDIAQIGTSTASIMLAGDFLKVEKNNVTEIVAKASWSQDGSLIKRLKFEGRREATVITVGMW